MLFKHALAAQALVAEMVGNFGKRLKPYGMTVKELTGDMNLSRAEIDEAQVRGDKPLGHGPRKPAWYAMCRSLLYCTPSRTLLVADTVCKHGYPNQLTRQPAFSDRSAGESAVSHADDCGDAGEVGHHHPQERRPHLHPAGERLPHAWLANPIPGARCTM